MFPIGWAEPGCKGSIERRRVAREEVSRHEHLQRTLIPIRGGFDTLDCSFLDDVEVFGRVAFAVVGLVSSWSIRWRADPDRMFRKEYRPTLEEERYGEAYFVIRLAASTIDRAPIPK